MHDFINNNNNPVEITYSTVEHVNAVDYIIIIIHTSTGGMVGMMVPGTTSSTQVVWYLGSLVCRSTFLDVLLFMITVKIQERHVALFNPIFQNTS